MKRGPATQDQGSDRGIVVVEWLLIIGVTIGLAALSVLIAQRVLPDASDVSTDPAVRLLDADIAAAFVAADGQALFDDGRYDDDTNARLEQACNAVAVGFADVAERAAWIDPRVGADQLTETVDDGAAACVVTPRRGLRG